MICLHYVALYGDEMLIIKVLEKYEDNAVEKRVDFDGNSALKYMEGRRELKYYVERLKPKPIVTIPDTNSVPAQPLVKTVKEKIVDSFNARKNRLTFASDVAKTAQEGKDDRRNRLAATDGAKHVVELNEMLGRIEKYDKTDQELIEYAIREVDARRQFAADEETRFSRYIIRQDNEYVQYIHKEAKETFENIKKDIEIL
jgi:hypothetical protein